MSESAAAGVATKSTLVRRRSVSRFTDPNEETIHALQKVIASLTETVEKGEEERNVLLLSMQAMSASLQEAANVQRNTAAATSAINTRSRSRRAVGERHGADGNQTLSAPSSRPVSPPTRSISPSAAAAFHKRPHGLNELDRSDSGPHESNSNDWKLFYHRTFDGETADARSFRNLLADHRAALSQMEALKRTSRKTAQEYEQRIRLMQRKLTEANEQAATFRDRCLVLEAEVSSLKREANGGGTLPLSHSHHTSLTEGWLFSRSVSFKSRAD